MSSLSEIDIRDWEKVDFEKVADVANNMEYDSLAIWQFYDQVLAMRERQLAEYNKKIPAILRKIDGIN